MALSIICISRITLSPACLLGTNLTWSLGTRWVTPLFSQVANIFARSFTSTVGAKNYLVSQQLCKFTHLKK